MNKIKEVWNFMWTEHGTKTLGFIQVTLGALVAVQGLVSDEVMRIFLIVNGVLVAWRGFFNSAVNSSTEK